jgi:23S rRNA (uracil1939-C5)-methyltransferase
VAEAQEVTIVRLGAQGDGIAAGPGGPVYVGGGLPGERWRLSHGGAPERLTDAPERATPPCPHFGVCGGCVAQHMSDDLYNAWKRDSVVQAFAHRGIAANVAPLRRTAAASRRRAFFGAARDGDRIVIGFREEGRHRLVDLATCVILDPAIVAALPPLRILADRILPHVAPGARLIVTRLDHGLDVAFETDALPGAAVLQEIAQLAVAAGVIRLSIGGDVVMQASAPTLTVGAVAVQPPPGLFLQAVPEAEAAMTDLVLGALSKTTVVADLFSGIGTLTFALARRARVLAVDGDKRAIAALTEGLKGAQGIKPVTAKLRDLFREPLSSRELDACDAVVFDPPRAGAQAQCERLARSKVLTVVAVSCNPATLARDARILLDGGYELGEVTPIDQFIYSPHVEAVAVFRRP